MENVGTENAPHLSTAPRLKWRDFRRLLAAQVNDDGDVYRATDTLLAENNSYAEHRCTGRIRLDDGVPSMSYCGRWHCWRCGDIRLWLERRRLQIGTERIAAAGVLWFTTVIDSDARRSVELVDFQSRLSGLLGIWRKKAHREGVELHYAVVYGFKSTGQIHAHIMANWLPAPMRKPTSRHQFRHVDEWLDGRAKKRQLTLWHELAQSSERVANYSANNLRSVLAVELPSNFQRITYSRGFPKLSSDDVPSVTGDALVDYAIAHFGAVVSNPSCDTIVKPSGDNEQHIYKDSQSYGTSAQSPARQHSNRAAPATQHRQRSTGASQTIVERRKNYANNLLKSSNHYVATERLERRRTAKEYGIAQKYREPP